MPANQELPGLPNTPVFPPTQQLMDQMVRNDSNYRPDPQNPELGRTVQGPQGWSANLRFIAPQRTTHTAGEFLTTFMDWWEGAVSQPLTNCPPPDNAERNTQPYSATLRKFVASADVIMPNGEWLPFYLLQTIEFDGRAAQGDITWPFDQVAVGQAIITALRETLGVPTVNSDGSHGPGIDVFFTHPEGIPPESSIFEAFGKPQVS